MRLLRDLLKTPIHCLILTAIGATAATGTQSAPLPFGGGFAENRGQWGAHVLAAADGGGLGLALVEDGLEVLLRGADVGLSARLRWAGSAPGGIASWELVGPLPGEHHYLTGEAGSHAKHIVVHASAVLRGATYALTVHADGEGWTLESRASELEFEVEGARVHGLAPSGELLLEVEGRSWRLPAPRVGEDRAGRWIVRARDEVALVTGPELPEIAAVAQVSPSIDWGTYLGTMGGDEYGRGATYDSDWRPLTCGLTTSTEFPTAVGPFTTAPGGQMDGFLTKLTSDGTELVFSTYIGGSGRDYLVAVDTASNDEIAILGLTQSTNWPTTPGAYDSVVGASGPFYAMAVVRLTEDGSTPIFSTFFGDQLLDGFLRYSTIAKDDGTILLCGDEGGVPSTLESAFGGAAIHDSFLAKFSADGSELLFSTPPPCEPFMAELSDGSIVVAGDRGWVGWGLPDSYQASVGGNASFDAWVGVVSSDGKDLLASTYLGGNEDDSCRGVAVDAQDNIFIGGTTESDSFPTVGSPLGWEVNEMVPGYIARFDRNLSGLQWTAMLGTEPFGNGGGIGQTSWQGLSCDRSGVVTAVGWQNGAAAPYFTAGAHPADPQFNAGRLVRLAPDGSRLLYAASVELPGPSLSGIRTPAVGRSPRTALLSGTELATFNSYPTSPGSFKDTCTGACSFEAVLSQWSFFHEGVELLGEGGESCLGVISLNTTRRADVGAQDFAFYVSQAPPTALGVLLLGSPVQLPLAVDGQTLWIDPAGLLPIQVFTTQISGYGALALGIPSGAAGKSFAAQAALLGTDLCGPAGAFVLSEAVRVTVP